MRWQDCLSYTAAHGIGAVEVLDYHLQDGAGYQEAKRLSQEFRLEVLCLTIVSDFSVIEAAWGEQALYLEAMMGRANDLGARFVRILAGEDPGGTGTVVRDRIAARLREVAEKAQKRGLTLLLENAGSCVSQSEDLAWVQEKVASRALRVNFDTANSLLVGEDPLRALEILQPWVSYLHVKDFAKTVCSAPRAQCASDGGCFVSCALGRGIVPLRQLLANAAKAGFAGPASIEYEGDASDTGPLDLCVEFMRACQPS